MKHLFVLIAFICALLSASAENYPYRSDFLWVTNPDHSNWLYKTGQSAVIEVQLYKYGVAVDCEATYEIADDMLPATTKGTVQMKNGKATIKLGTRKTPGFKDLALTTVIDGVKTQHHVKVGFDVEKISPYTKMPNDFKDFWKKTVEEARQTPLSYSREYVKELSTDKIDCWLVRLQIDKKHCMYGYLTMPKGAKAGNCPAVMCPPGAGIKTIKEPLRHKYYAENGFIRVETEIHGLDPRLSSNTFDEISKAFSSSENGYLINNIESKERYYMRHVYAGMARWIDFLASLPEWDGKNMAVQGGSQGGALALITAALDERVTLCVANHPALTDMAAYAENGRTGGYPHFNKIKGVLTNENGTPNKSVIDVLQYYDVVNFCKEIKCPVRMTWGYNDNTCPPTTSYAAWNVLKCEKESFITPINEHWTSEKMEQQHMDWIKARVK